MTVQNDADMNEVYRDRAHILALLALHYPAHLSYSDPNYPHYPVLILETPHGQMSWHIAPEDVELFVHVPRASPEGGAAAYDGHTTEEKHRRIQMRLASFPVLS